MKTRQAIITAAMTFVAPLAIHGAVLAGPLTNAANGHIYYLLTTNTWTGAEAEATSLGGHLTTIDDVSENHWIYTNFTSYGGTSRALWIGLTDRNVPGAWEWVSGESVGFTYWASGQPNNSPIHGPQRWAMLWPLFDGVDVPDREKWNDYWDVPLTVDQSLPFGMHGVVEVRPISTNSALTAAIRRAVEVSFLTQSNQWYRVERAPQVDSNAWRTFGPYILGNGSTAQVFDVTDEADRKFYRIVPVRP